MSHRLPPIKGFLRCSLIEWEGRITDAIFLPGCPFRCPFCHAAQLVLRPQSLDRVPFEEVAAHLDEQQGWVDGVVVSGGEPTGQRGLAALIGALREHVPAIKLDTNGSHPEVVEGLIQEGLVDFVAMDVKAPLGEAYDRAAGVAVDQVAIAASIELLRRGGVGHEFRTTVVPGLHSVDDIVAIARLVGEGEPLVLQQFAPLNCLDPSYMERRPFTRHHLREMAEAAARTGAECRVRGDATLTGATR